MGLGLEVVVGQVDRDEGRVQKLMSLAVDRAVEVVHGVYLAVHTRGGKEGILTDTGFVDPDVVNSVSDLVQVVEDNGGLVVVVGAHDNVAGLDKVQAVLDATLFLLVHFLVISVGICHSIPLS